ncbi:MAG: YidC/Oxa1 family membrane protein insertase, partial [Bdellovibrionales bacterium]|nr:YidC/Oxa1 family membrane protein insertase [Bdellovibrionales bacterium]
MILLTPFIFVIRFFFTLFLEWTGNPGVSVLLLSLTVGILLRPLYRLIDRLRAMNEIRKQKFVSVESEIKETYAGYTQSLYLKALYRQNNYNSLYNHLPLLGTLLQIPFFFAAYTYLLPLDVFKGVGFLGVSDLSKPDQLIPFAGISINFLPIFMTILNFCAIRLLGKKSGEAKSLGFMALIFLVLLYSMPSALLFYWTMNNVIAVLTAVSWRELQKRDFSVIRSLYRIQRSISTLW